MFGKINSLTNRIYFMSSLNEDQLTIKSIHIVVNIAYTYVLNETYVTGINNYSAF